jgi:hypothetical protein
MDFPERDKPSRERSVARVGGVKVKEQREKRKKKKKRGAG